MCTQYGIMVHVAILAREVGLGMRTSSGLQYEMLPMENAPWGMGVQLLVSNIEWQREV